jgi:MinD superfamily P-loop ATPase
MDAVAGLGIPLGVVVNRSDIGDREVQEFCRSRDIPILAEIPHSRRIAEGYSQGRLLVESEPAHRETFLRIFAQIEQGAAGTEWRSASCANS